MVLLLDPSSSAVKIGCNGHTRMYAARDLCSKTVIKLGTKVTRALIIMKGVIEWFWQSGATNGVPVKDQRVETLYDEVGGGGNQLWASGSRRGPSWSSLWITSFSPPAAIVKPRQILPRKKPSTAFAAVV